MLSAFIILFSIVAIVILLISTTFISAFLGHIILFDSGVSAVLIWAYCRNCTPVHNAICLLIGIGVFFGLTYLQYTKFGFWIIGGAATLFYAGMAGEIAYDAAGGDSIWKWVIFGIAFVFVGILHLNAREQGLSDL